MQTEQLIRVDNFCTWHNIEFSFIRTLYEFGLIDLTTKEDTTFLPESEVQQAEKLVRLHNELDINPEGVEVVNYLLEKMKQQQEEIIQLRNRLRFYES